VRRLKIRNHPQSVGLNVLHS